MDNISGDMKSLCEDIAAAHGDRKRSIKDLVAYQFSVSPRTFKRWLTD